jgi:hypothetical protein
MFACVSPDIQAAEMIPLLKLVSADENAAAKVIAVESYVDIAYELHQGIWPVSPYVMITTSLALIFSRICIHLCPRPQRSTTGD